MRRRPGWTLVHAAKGSTGLSLAESDAPDLILLDLVLPDMSGFEVMRRLEANPETAAIPVVTVSADARSRQALLLEPHVARGHLVKPYDVADLLGFLDACAREPAWSG